MKTFLKNTTAIVLSFNLAFAPVVTSYADGINVDPAAAAAHQANVTAAPNGVPLVNIARPSGAGVSHNKFLDFNVTNQGVILNNSTTVGVSQLGGALNSNPNLAGTAGARLIINEVTSGNSSLLEGHTEIFGRSAEYILANPNGITCSGCGFINTPRSTLTTGTPVFAPDGNLQSLSVDRGTITIGGTGLDASNVDYFDIVSRSSEINAAINAKELNITAGRNDYDYATRAATAKADDGSFQPAFAIDSTALGGMYANRITLVGTEAGVGVRAAGDMAATGGDLALSADGTISFAKATASNNLTANSANGGIALNGNGYGGNGLDLSATNGTITFGADTTSGAQNTVALNAENVTLEDNVALVAGLSADGKTTQSGNLSATVTDTLHSQKGLIASGGDITLNAENLNNDEGVVLAIDDIIVQGTAGGKSQSVLNQSGTIESTKGDITIQTEDLTNKKKVFTTTTKEIYRAGHAFSGNSHPGCNSVPGAKISSAGCGYFGGREIARVPHWEKDNFVAYYSGKGTITDWVLESSVDQDSAASLISSGKDLFIDATSLLNSNSDITAVNDIDLKGTTFNNNGTKLTRDYYVSSNYKKTTRCYGGVCAWFGDGGGTALLERNEISSINSSIVSGGTITLDYDSEINNATIVETADSANIKRKNYISEVGGVTSTPDGDVPLLDIASLGDPGPLLVKNPDPTALGPVIESRFEFADLGTFFGSDYFLEGNGLTPGDARYEDLPRRLGDAFLDTRLVRDAIIRKTGERWLNPAVQDDIAQMKTLLDNGIAEAEDLELAVGITLTTEQIAALTSDIVWYVTEIFEGQEVLVPRLYLAQNSRSKLLPKGAIIASTDQYLISRENSIRNRGHLNAINNLILTAEEDVINSSGSIRAGNNVRLVAESGNVINETATYELRTDGTDVQTVRNARGEIFTGGTLDVVADSDIIVRGADLAAVGDTTLTAGNDVQIGSIELRDKKHHTHKAGYTNIDSTTNVGSTVLTDGNLVITAGKDATVKGSAVAAGQDLTIRAGDNINITSAQDQRTYDYKLKKKTFGGSSSREGNGLKITQQASAVGAGNNLVLDAGDNIVVSASNLSAGNDASLKAGQDISLLPAQEYSRDNHQYSKKTGGSLGIGKALDHREEHQTFEQTTITANNNLDLQADRNISIVASDLNAGNDLTVDAGNELYIASVTEKHNIHHEESKTGPLGGVLGGSTSLTRIEQNTTVVETEIISLNDLTTQSGDDTTIKASSLDAGGDLKISVGVGPFANPDAKLNLLSEKERDYLSVQEFDGGVLKWTMKEYGHERETVRHALLHSKGDFVIESPGGVVVDFRSTGDFQKDIAQLKNAPGLEYLGALTERDDVNWVAVEEVYREWSRKESGLGGGAMAILAIVTAIATYGAGSSLAASMLGLQTVTGTAAAGAVTTTLTGGVVVSGTVSTAQLAFISAINAGITSLATTTTTSLANGAVSGDIGGAFKDIISSDNLRSLAVSIVTAGLTQGVAGGLDIDAGKASTLTDKIAYQSVRTLVSTAAQSTIGGQDLDEALKANLVSSAVNISSSIAFKAIGDISAKDNLNLEEGDIRKVLLHATAGCAIGQAASKNCMAGAIGAGLQELVGGALNEFADDPNLRIQLAGLAGALATALVGGDEDAINTANDIAQYASTYNRQLHTNEIQALDAKAEELAGTDGLSANEWRKILGQEALRQVDATKAHEFEENPKALAILQAMDGYGTDFPDKLGKQLSFLSKDDYFGRASVFAAEIMENEDFYNVVLADYVPWNFEHLYDIDDPDTLKGLVSPALLGAASALSDVRYGSLEGATLPDTEAEKIAYNLALIKTLHQLNTVGGELDTVVSELHQRDQQGALSPEESKAFNALNNLYTTLKLDSTVEVATELNDKAGIGFAKGYGNFLAENAKAVGQLLYGTGELYADTIGQVLGDEASAARNQERLKSLEYIISHLGEFPDAMQESLKQSLTDANARFEAGDYEGGGEILGEMQANIMSAAGGTAGLITLGAAGGAKAVKATKSVDNWAKGGRNAINRTQLIDDLVTGGTRITPENVVDIRSINGRTVWLETGNSRAGLQHIVGEHGSEFAQRGISEAQIPDVVFTALQRNNIVGHQGRGTGRPIYEFEYGGKTHQLAITVGDNGFIVGANFR